eukprot:gene9094-18840_t
MAFLQFYLGSPYQSFEFPSLAIARDLENEFLKCQYNMVYCEINSTGIINLSARVSNEYSSLLMHDQAQTLLQGALRIIPLWSIVGKKLSYMLAVLAFSQGDLVEAKKHCSVGHLLQQQNISTTTNNDKNNSNLIPNTTTLIPNSSQPLHHPLNDSQASSAYSTPSFPNLVRSLSSEEVEDDLLSLLLSEAQGTIRIKPRITDIFLALSEVTQLEAKFRFRLGVGLAKLGLFELSLRHISLSSTPWEAPLYRLRARLVFPPVHSSLRALAQAVDEFERQAEAELLRGPPRSSLMNSLCNSLTECALALQSLPLLHLAGYSAPMNADGLALGHSPVALPVLLGEVFSMMCPPSPVPAPENFTVSMMSYKTTNSISNNVIKRNNLNNDDDDTVDAANTITGSSSRGIKSVTSSRTYRKQQYSYENIRGLAPLRNKETRTSPIDTGSVDQK